MRYEPTYDELLDYAIGHLRALFELDCGEPVWKVHTHLMAVTEGRFAAVDATLLNEYGRIGDRAGYLAELKRHTLATVERALEAATP